MANQIGAGGAAPDGTAIQGGSVLGTAYARRLGLDLSTPALRGDLLRSWLTVTDRRLLFHRPKELAIRPTPGRLTEAMPRDGVRLHWFDVNALAVRNRVVHLVFPDGRHVLSATLLRATARRKPVSDEPRLLVEAFGPLAVHVA